MGDRCKFYKNVFGEELKKIVDLSSKRNKEISVPICFEAFSRDGQTKFFLGPKTVGKKRSVKLGDCPGEALYEGSVHTHLPPDSHLPSTGDLEIALGLTCIVNKELNLSCGEYTLGPKERKKYSEKQSIYIDCVDGNLKKSGIVPKTKYDKVPAEIQKIIRQKCTLPFVAAVKPMLKEDSSLLHPFCEIKL
jgi:hypothetical protein